MKEITIYLDKETEEKLYAFIERKQIPQNEWIVTLIQEKLASEWPESVVTLAGAWQDSPEVKKIHADLSEDVERESL